MTSNLGNLANVISSVIEDVVDDRLKSCGKEINKSSIQDLIKSIEMLNQDVENQKKAIGELIDQNLFLSQEMDKLMKKINRPGIIERLATYVGWN